MVFSFKFVKVDVKLPVPVPLVVWGPLTVGLCEVLQHTPRAVTVDPPSEVTLPPQVAVLTVILLILAVVTVGGLDNVGILNCELYAVPTEFVS